jgi:hypothetical protein
LVSSTQALKEKILFWRDFWPSQYNVYRNRGDHFVLDEQPAVRLKYDDEINRHRLRSGEELPAAPLRYVTNKQDGTPLIHAAEAEDGQMVVFKHDFKPEEIHEAVAMLDTPLEEGEVEEQLANYDHDLLQLSVLDNREERKTFLAEELEISGEKYSLSGLINRNQGAVYALATGLAVAIIIYATASNFGEYIPVLRELTGALQGVSPENIASGIGEGGSQGPPG